MLATPLRVSDIVAGHLFYVATRVVVAASLYLSVVAAVGAVHSPWAVFGPPLSILIGLAFAPSISALSAWAENEIFNPLFRFVITPMFLFSGIFFPVTRLPHGLRELAYALPLWHGVDEFRRLTLGTPTLGSTALHVGYLSLWAVVGTWLARRAYAKALVT
jgi:lipooligosaccharide transport system permease protein